VIEKSIAKKKEERYETPVALIDAAFATFGISGGCAEWADKPEAELVQALRAAREAAAVSAVPQPGPQPGLELAAPGLAQLATQSLPPPPTARATRSPGIDKRMLLVAGVAAVGLIALGCVASAIYYLI
jgi:hypothetical protein